MIDAELLTSVSYAPLDAGHLDRVFALHMEVTRTVARNDLVKPETRDFFARILGGGGSIVGAWRGDGLIGYGVLQLDLPPSEDARPHFGLEPRHRLAKLAGASVLPHEWGAGLHDALIGKRVAEARRLGVEHLYATAAPGNARSWENLIDAGFSVRAIVEKYGGHLRFLLYRRDGAGQVDDGSQWCDAGDAPRQRALLGEGLAGCAWRKREDGGREICYRRTT